MIYLKNKKNYSRLFILVFFGSLLSCTTTKVKQTTVGLGWSNNSVNTVKFRKNALTSFGDFQFIAYYDPEGYVVLGKRNHKDTQWQIQKTTLKGNTKDAHNDISIAVDGKGFLHLSWDHHNTPLRYTKSIKPLELGLEPEQSMTGLEEKKVSYPEFYNLPNGNLMFLYRSGGSGKGNLLVNEYNATTQKWGQLHKNLIDGQEKRSAYWQTCVDKKGTIHLSWVWRETWDVDSNHDMCYARSNDGGHTWEKSNGEKYQLPITAATAEYAWKINQKSSLINQTAITTDAQGNPFIATYWSENGTPQFQVIYLNEGKWNKLNSGFRKTPFYLGGGGTKKILIARPDILIDQSIVYLLFRDEERGNKISMAYCNWQQKTDWKIVDLDKQVVNQWEPNYDIELWNRKKMLHLFVQQVNQVDSEGVSKSTPTTVSVLEWNELPKK
ncbi:MAG: hypothetical protein QG594_1303 [Bacteroidota bacterium]|nr:hypothetical protein [Bacteroidota bacterium]